MKLYVVLVDKLAKLLIEVVSDIFQLICEEMFKDLRLLKLIVLSFLMLLVRCSTLRFQLHQLGFTLRQPTLQPSNLLLESTAGRFELGQGLPLQRLFDLNLMQHPFLLVFEVTLDLTHEHISLLDHLAQAFDLCFLRRSLSLECLNDSCELSLYPIKDFWLNLLLLHYYLTGAIETARVWKHRIV